MTEAELKGLLRKWKNHQLSSSEIDHLFNVIASADAEKVISEELLRDLATGRFTGFETQADKERIRKQLMDRIEKDHDKKPATIVRPFKVWKKLAAAMMAGLIAAFGYWFFKNNNTVREKTQAIIPAVITAPNANYAVVQLPNGAKVMVDSLKEGDIFEEFGLKVNRKANGVLTLISTQETGKQQPVLLKVQNPRASRPLKLQLADGTMVWLNAQSAIEYPAVFANDQRTVEVSGEAYFEVTKNPARKFIVRSGSFRTEVLGTMFNVKAYPNDASRNVTLIEGVVNVISNQPGSTRQQLRPGQQVTIENNKIAAPQAADIDDVLAWKNDLLSFNNADLKTILEEIGRWYDVEILYNATSASRTFSGKIPRSTNLAEVLQILRKSGVKIELNNRTIEVTQ